MKYGAAERLSGLFSSGSFVNYSHLQINVFFRKHTYFVTIFVRTIVHGITDKVCLAGHLGSS